MSIKNIFFSAFLILTTSLAFGKSKGLATIIRTDNNEKITITLNTDINDDLESIIVTSKKRTQNVSFKKIRSNSGATLLKRRGIKVARIQSDDLDKVHGGHINFIYLKKFNIFSKNTYGLIKLRILKSKSGKWSLFKKSKAINKILVTPYSWGIKKVRLK